MLRGERFSELMRKDALDRGKFSKYLETLKEDVDYLSTMVYHSNTIEGNTMTMSDTKKALESIHVSGEVMTKDLEGDYSPREVNEVQDLANAAMFMYDESMCGTSLDEEFILNLHALTCENDGRANPGVYKKSDNYTTHSGVMHRYLSADKVERETLKMITQYNCSNHEIQDISRMVMKFTQIHPFDDGNGRVSRLLLNWALLSQKYPPVIIKSEEKPEYIKLLMDFDDTDNENPFAEFILEKVCAALETILS